MHAGRMFSFLQRPARGAVGTRACSRYVNRQLLRRHVNTADDRGSRDTLPRAGLGRMKLMPMAIGMLSEDEGSKAAVDRFGPNRIQIMTRKRRECDTRHDFLLSACQTSSLASLVM